MEEHPEAPLRIGEKLSAKRTLRVGCEARQELSSVEIKSKPNRVNSLRLERSKVGQITEATRVLLGFRWRILIVKFQHLKKVGP